MIYLITSIFYDHHKFLRNSSRTFGYYLTLEHAVDAVERNVGSMSESLYNYLVIEEVGEGIHYLAEAVRWYIWDDEKNCWARIIRPVWASGTVNWGIG